MGAICSLILLFRGKVLCPQPSAWTQIKKETRIAQTLHGLVFYGSFFDVIELMIIGFLFGLSRICKCWSTSSSGSLFSDLFLSSLIYCRNKRSIIITKWARSWQHFCPIGATCLPMLGTLLAPLGHAACPKTYCLIAKRHVVTTQKEYSCYPKETVLPSQRNIVVTPKEHGYYPKATIHYPKKYRHYPKR